MTQLNWRKCPCGHSHCKLEWPTNFGQYYQGCGFSPEEKVKLEEAFQALEILNAIRRIVKEPK